MASQDHEFIRVLGAPKLENRWMYMTVWFLIGVNLLAGLIQTYLGAMLFSFSDVPQAITIGAAMAIGTCSVAILQGICHVFLSYRFRHSGGQRRANDVWQAVYFRLVNMYTLLVWAPDALFGITLFSKNLAGCTAPDNTIDYSSTLPCHLYEVITGISFVMFVASAGIYALYLKINSKKPFITVRGAFRKPQKDLLLPLPKQGCSKCSRRPSDQSTLVGSETVSLKRPSELFRKRSVPSDIGKEAGDSGTHDCSSEYDDIEANSPGHQAATKLRRLHTTRLPKPNTRRPPASADRISTIVAPIYPTRESPDIMRPLLIPRQRPRRQIESPTPPPTPDTSRTVPQPRREKLCYTYPLVYSKQKQSIPSQTDNEPASPTWEDCRPDEAPEEDETADIVDHYLDSDSRTSEDSELSMPRPLHVNPTRHDPWVYKAAPVEKMQDKKATHAPPRAGMRSHALSRPSPLQQCFGGEVGVEKPQMQPFVFPKRIPFQELDRNQRARRPVPGTFPDSSERLTFM